MSFWKDFEHLKIQLDDIKSATNDFADEPIGVGGFGRVYKGELSLPKGRRIVAFKRLDRRFGQGDAEFWREIMMLSRYRHENLVSLLNFCHEGDEKILVYEYASRGSLDRYLSDTSLTWTQRVKICVEAAHGINYLHDPKETQHRVLHRDIKSSNILLDEKWTAKVSDFGLSKMGPANLERTYFPSNVVGTHGYCDPLYMEMGCLSKESDIYSFGVVLFEVICGRLCYEYRNRELFILVPTWKKCFEEKRLDEIIFHDLKEQMDSDSLNTFLAIASKCLKRDREERPKMAKIVEQLELALKQQESYEAAKTMHVDEEKIHSLMEITNLAIRPLLYTSQKEFLSLLNKGILLTGGRTQFSINKKGENCEMIFATKCVGETSCMGKSSKPKNGSRIKNVLFYMGHENFTIDVSTQFLSPHVTYTINLVYKYEYGLHGLHVPFKYKLDEETQYSTSCVARRREDKWLVTELYQFTSYQKEHNFRIRFKGDKPFSPGGYICLEGIDFRPVEYEKDENLEDETKVDMQPITDSDIDWERKLPCDYTEIIKWSKDSMQRTSKKEHYYLLRQGFLINNGKQWFSINKNGMKRHMLPAKAIFKEGKSMWKSFLGRDEWIWKSMPESRFDMVAEFLDIERVAIFCDIESRLLSPQTFYACYLVYKLPENHSISQGLVKLEHRNLGSLFNEFIYLVTPPHTPIIRSDVDQEPHSSSRTRKIKGHPKLRKDGWMEIQVWEFRTDDTIKTISMGRYLRYCNNWRCNNWRFTGLLVQGIEFRPAKVFLSN